MIPGEDMIGRRIGTAASLLAAVLLLTLPAGAVSARKAVVMDSVGKRICYEKQAGDRSLIASTTKIMTALLVCENCNVLEPVKIPRQAVGVEGSSLYLKEGEVLTVQELLYGLMLHSGNDAAAALAIHCGGSIDGFAAMMNEKAERLGLTGSHFENPHGLDSENHYSTARDLAVLGLEAMKNPIFRKTVSTKRVRIGDRYLKNHNKLLWQIEGCEGIKTGYTKAAGRILVSSVTRQGRRIAAVTISAPDDWRDHRILYEKAFEEFETRQLFHKGQRVLSYPVAGGEKTSVPLKADGDFSFPVREGEQAMVILPGPGFCYAPVVRGAQAGTALVVIDGTVVGKLPLVYGRTVEIPQEAPGFWERLFGGNP